MQLPQPQPQVPPPPALVPMSPAPKRPRALPPAAAADPAARPISPPAAAPRQLPWGGPLAPQTTWRESGWPAVAGTYTHTQHIHTHAAHSRERLVQDFKVEGGQADWSSPQLHRSKADSAVQSQIRSAHGARCLCAAAIQRRTAGLCHQAGQTSTTGAPRHSGSSTARGNPQK